MAVDLRRLYGTPRFQALAERVGPMPPGAFAEVEVLDLLLALSQLGAGAIAALGGAPATEEDAAGAETAWDLVREWRCPDMRSLVQWMLLERTGAAVEIVRRARGMEELAGLDPPRTTVVLYWLCRKLGRDEVADELGRRYHGELAALEPLLSVCRVLLRAGREAPDALDELRAAHLRARPGSWA